MTQSMFQLLVALPGAGSVRGDIRGTAVSGVEPVGHRIRPFPVILPVYWTVGISPRGEGLTGRGNSFPFPCLPHSNHLISRRHPPARASLPVKSSCALPAGTPAPEGGQGQWPGRYPAL